MEHSRQLTDRLTVGGQPGNADLGRLAGRGFRSVINLRSAGEDDQPLSPEEERSKAAESGLRYAHLPVDSREPAAAQADEFCRLLSTLPHPVYVHCHAGSRAMAFALIALAVHNGINGDEILRHAQQLGSPIQSETLRAFVKEYVDRRVASAG